MISDIAIDIFLSMCSLLRDISPYFLLFTSPRISLISIDFAINLNKHISLSLSHVVTDGMTYNK